MILTGTEIAREREAGKLHIEPYEPQNTNPVSHNYRLGPVLRTHSSQVIDSTGPQPLEDFVIPPEGLVLRPGRIYLGTTVEEIGGSDYVTTLIGRSSIGRLGLFVQYAADLGNLGTAHQWTLELKVIQPLRVYPHMKLGQVCFWKPVGEHLSYTGFFGQHSVANTAPPHTSPRTGNRT
ncbi:hypothetical protein KGD82_27975 (plasmid) [Nocardiopsis eucommiae]|uniref:Deoxycytidine deaminase n=1 Tax=Nocardiopsis eucommiae TaxID=2831970 RepID=A0A975QMK9_9ACTN|nr:hypothetical protein KGD82_27975 [Nocardiopsis eucommiae]